MLANVQPPMIQNASFLSNSGWNLVFSGPSGQNYSIIASTNLLTPMPDWSIVSTGTFGFNPVYFNDNAATNYSQRFYTITLQQ
jgi:hypothetical protein